MRNRIRQSSAWPAARSAISACTAIAAPTAPAAVSEHREHRVAGHVDDAALLGADVAEDLASCVE